MIIFLIKHLLLFECFTRIQQADILGDIDVLSSNVQPSQSQNTFVCKQRLQLASCPILLIPFCDNFFLVIRKNKI